MPPHIRYVYQDEAADFQRSGTELLISKLPRQIVCKVTHSKSNFRWIWFNSLVKTSLWKILFTCLMLIAIPVQGFAGAFAAVCEGNHQALYGAPETVVFNDSHTHSTAEPFTQSMIVLADQASDQIASAVDQNGHPSPTEAVHLKCSACGPCCIGAALVSTAEAFVLQFDGKFKSPEISSHHLSPALAGLDRPPQAIHA